MDKISESEIKSSHSISDHIDNNGAYTKKKIEWWETWTLDDLILIVTDSKPRTVAVQ